MSDHHSIPWLLEKLGQQTSALLTSEALFHTLVEKNADGLMIVDTEGVIHYANPAAERMFLAKRGELKGEMFGYPILDGETTEIDVVHATKRKTSAEMMATPIEWEGGSAHLVSLRNAAERKRLKESLHKTADRLRALINAAPLAILAVDLEGRVTLWSRSAERIFGWNEQEVLGQPLPIASADGEDSLQAVCEETLREDAAVDQELPRQVRKDGDLVDISVWTARLLDAKGTTAGAMAVAVDTSERQRAREEAQYLATHDALTGLPNRFLFRDRLRQAVTQAARTGRAVGVLHLGLDRFKTINQSLGHSSGDDLLRELALRLKECLYSEDTVARLGGDEFAALLPNLNQPENMTVVTRKLLEAAAAPFQVEGTEVFTTASLGVALFPHDGESAEELLRNAETAMLRAKEEGGGHGRFYTQDMNALARERFTLETDLRHALERDELTLHYQPQLDLKSGRIVGVEALVRWRHRNERLIPPTHFIPLAESTGLIAPIGDWVLRTAAAQAMAWRAAGLPPTRVAVNLSPRQFEAPDLVEKVTGILDGTGLPPDHLELEITESTLMRHPEAAAAVLRRLRALGIRIALDDFGTGHSSLSYLKRFPVDALKIDRSFVNDIGGDAQEAALASAIVALGRSLRLRVVAEGVETAEQMAFLRAQRCHEVQGFFFSPPVPAEECAVLLGSLPPAGGPPALIRERGTLSPAPQSELN